MKLQVSVAVALPGRQDVIEIEVRDGATVGDALDAARVFDRFPELRQQAVELGVWSRACRRDTPLRAGDRIEIYRSLKADAKAQRRARARLKPASPRSRNGP